MVVDQRLVIEIVEILNVIFRLEIVIKRLDKVVVNENVDEEDSNLLIYILVERI